MGKKTKKTVQKDKDGNIIYEDREILCNLLHEDFSDNSISTGKYTCITFIPINLFE